MLLAKLDEVFFVGKIKEDVPDIIYYLQEGLAFGLVVDLTDCVDPVFPKDVP